jgi:hypothetical protein
MTWARLDDDLHDHPKIVAIENPNDPLNVWVRLLTWTSRAGTRGFIPRAVALKFGKPKALARLVEIGLFEREGDNYRFHDFEHYAPPKRDGVDERRQIGGRARAASAERSGGRFAPSSTSTSPASSPPASPASPANAGTSKHQLNQVPDPDPDPDPDLSALSPENKKQKPYRSTQPGRSLSPPDRNLDVDPQRPRLASGGGK